MTARSSPVAPSEPLAVRPDRNALLLGRGFEHHHGFRRERRKVDPVLGSMPAPGSSRLAPRADLGGCGDVVAVARIVAAQRPVGALDDPLGAFDNSVKR